MQSALTANKAGLKTQKNKSFQGISSSLSYKGNRPDIGDPQFPEWFNQYRGEKDHNLIAVKNLCIAFLIMGARDLLNTSHTKEALQSKESAQYWIDHPMETMVPFSFCCYMVGIRVPYEEARMRYLDNLVAIAPMTMPNTGYPLDGEESNTHPE